jgi:hypothetical protein
MGRSYQQPRRAKKLVSASRTWRGGLKQYFLYGAPKTHDHYGLSIFCMDKR